MPPRSINRRKSKSSGSSNEDSSSPVTVRYNKSSTKNKSSVKTSTKKKTVKSSSSSESPIKTPIRKIVKSTPKKKTVKSSSSSESTAETTTEKRYNVGNLSSENKKSTEDKTVLPKISSRVARGREINKVLENPLPRDLVDIVTSYNSEFVGKFYEIDMLSEALSDTITISKDGRLFAYANRNISIYDIKGNHIKNIKFESENVIFLSIMSNGDLVLIEDLISERKNGDNYWNVTVFNSEDDSIIANNKYVINPPPKPNGDLFFIDNKILFNDKNNIFYTLDPFSNKSPVVMKFDYTGRKRIGHISKYNNTLLLDNEDIYLFKKNKFITKLEIEEHRKTSAKYDEERDCIYYIILDQVESDEDEIVDKYYLVTHYLKKKKVTKTHLKFKKELSPQYYYSDMECFVVNDKLVVNFLALDNDPDTFLIERKTGKILSSIIVGSRFEFKLLLISMDNAIISTKRDNGELTIFGLNVETGLMNIIKNISRKEATMYTFIGTTDNQEIIFYDPINSKITIYY